MAEDRQSFSIKNDKSGEVHVAGEVVAIIAGLAATEVEGVSSMAGNITNELMSKVGMKSLTKGVKIDVTDGEIAIDLAVTMEYGYNIPETCTVVQEKVKTAVENMTGLSCKCVNIRIAGINMKKDK